MLKLELCFGLELRDDALGQDLTQLNAPLVERVKIPDGALGENRVLVEGHQFAECFRRESLNKNHVRGTVALKHSMRRQPLRRTLSLDLLSRLPKRERFCLGKDVG